MKIASILLALLFIGCANTDKADKYLKEHLAALYPEKLGYKVLVAECQPTDSDKNGYCSCNASVQTPKNEVEIPSVECACGWVQVWTEGCKMLRSTR